jgi:hypothetical protein
MKTVNMAFVITLGFALTGAGATYANPLDGIFGGSPPKFGLLKTLGLPYEQFRAEAGERFIQKPLTNPKDWNCSPSDKCVTYNSSIDAGCWVESIYAIERAGEIIRIDVDYNYFLKCGGIPNTFKRVKEKIGDARKPEVIFKVNGGDYVGGASFSAFWENGDIITRVDAFCPILDPAQRKFENFRNCSVTGFSQKKCFSSGCRDLSDIKKLKQYDY